jgi:hypothetical protein
MSSVSVGYEGIYYLINSCANFQKYFSGYQLELTSFKEINQLVVKIKNEEWSVFLENT